MPFFQSFEQRVQTLIYSLEFSNGFRRQLTTVLTVLYFLSLGHDVVKVTSMFAVSTVLLMLFQFPAGAFADHHSRKRALVVSTSLMSLSFLGLFLFKNFYLLSLSYILSNIAWTFQAGSNSACLVDELRSGGNKLKISSLIAKLTFFERLGAILGGLIGFLIIMINFRLIWLIIFIIYALLTAVFIKYLEEKNFCPAKTEHNFILKTYLKVKESLSYIIHKKNRQIKGLSLSVVFATFTIDSYYITGPLILSQLFLISTDKISGLFSIIALATLFAPFLGEKLIHWFGFKTSLAATFLGISSFIIIFALSRSAILSVAALLMTYVIHTASGTVHDSAVQHAIPSHIRATLGSAMGFLWGVGDVLAASLTGLGIKFLGLTTTTLIIGLTAFLTAIVYYVGLKE